MALSPLNCRLLPSKHWNREIVNLFEILKINKFFLVASNEILLNLIFFLMDIFFKKILYTIHIKMPIKPLIDPKIPIFLYRSNSTSFLPIGSCLLSIDWNVLDYGDYSTANKNCVNIKHVGMYKLRCCVRRRIAILIRYNIIIVLFC